MKTFLRKRTAQTALAVVALLTVVSGVAYATIPDSNGIIHGCYANKDGTLRVIDTATSQTCLSKETAVSWNQTGPQGPVGPQGPAGASRYLTVGVYHPADGTVDATIDTSASNTSATVTNPQPGVYCIGGVSPAPVSAVITAHDNINFSSSPPRPGQRRHDRERKRRPAEQRQHPRPLRRHRPSARDHLRRGQQRDHRTRQSSLHHLADLSEISNG